MGRGYKRVKRGLAASSNAQVDPGVPGTPEGFKVELVTPEGFAFATEETRLREVASGKEFTETRHVAWIPGEEGYYTFSSRAQFNETRAVYKSLGEIEPRTDTRGRVLTRETRTVNAINEAGMLPNDARVSGNVFAGRNRYGDWYAMYRGHQISSGHTNASRAISKGLEALGDVKDPRTRMKRAAELVSNVTLGRSSQGRAQPRRFGSPPPGFIDITGAR